MSPFTLSRIFGMFLLAGTVAIPVYSFAAAQKTNLVKRIDSGQKKKVARAIQPRINLKSSEKIPDAILYLEDNFGGKSTLFLCKGDAIKDLSKVTYFADGKFQSWDDKIKSVKVVGVGEVVLYAKKDFNGAEFKARKDTKSIPIFGSKDRPSSCKIP